MAAKIGAAPSGELSVMVGTEKFPVTGSKFVQGSTIVNLAKLQKLSAFAATSSAELASVISDETGSGALVFGTNSVLTTPNLGVPSAATLTNATGLPVSTGISGLGTGVATLLGGTSSGSGGIAGTTSPIFVAPTLGTAACTQLNMTGAVQGGTNVTMNNTGFLGTASRGGFVWSADGVMRLRNNGDTDFSRLQFGGTTSSFPAIKRSTTSLGIRLADDSADADLTAAHLISSATIRLKGYTVATLPSGIQGDEAFVTDALTPAFLTTIVGGGSVVAPVFYNGTNWVGA